MQNKLFIGAVLMMGTMLSGCAEFQEKFGNQPSAENPQEMVQAAPVVEVKEEPPVVTVYKPMPMPGQLKKIEEPGNIHKSVDAATVIEEANKIARQTPDMDGYFNSVMNYAYDDGALYQVYSAALRLTDIQFQPGETIIDITIGDPLRWTIGRGKSKVNGQIQEHVYVKPNNRKPGLETTMFVNTDRRSYAIELHSFKETYMAQVSWEYPQDEITMYETAAAIEAAEQSKVTASHVNLDALNFNYAIETVKGDNPSWKPQRVWDDGRKTFVQFPPEMLVREAPVIYVMANDEAQLVQYRVKNDYYIIDRLFDAAELRLGAKDQTIVRISRGASSERVASVARQRFRR